MLLDSRFYIAGSCLTWTLIKPWQQLLVNRFLQPTPAASQHPMKYCQSSSFRSPTDLHSPTSPCYPQPLVLHCQHQLTVPPLLLAHPRPAA
jgi:hypothetical protein